MTYYTGGVYQVLPGYMLTLRTYSYDTCTTSTECNTSSNTLSPGKVFTSCSQKLAVSRQHMKKQTVSKLILRSLLFVLTAQVSAYPLSGA